MDEEVDYNINAVVVRAGDLVGYRGIGGHRLRFKASGGKAFTSAETPPPSIVAGQQIDISVDLNAKYQPGISYRFRPFRKPQAHRSLKVAIGIGQSLSEGTTPVRPGIEPKALTIAPPGGKVRMPNGGVRIMRNDFGPNDALDPNDIRALVAASAQVEGGTAPSGQHYGETHLEGLAYKLAADLGWDMVIFAAGVGGHPHPANDASTLTEYEDGARIGYDPKTHALTAILPGGATVRIDANGGLLLKGDVTVDGDIKSTGTITASTDVVGAGKSLKDHVHLGVQAGGALSGKPQ